MTLWVRSHAGWRRTVPEPVLWRRNEGAVALVAASVAGLYLGGGYVWDDTVLISGELVHYGSDELVQLWSRPIREEGPGAAYYRPLALSALAVLGRGGPLLVHIAALFLHAASAWLLTRLLKGRRWPLAGGLVFATHPMASEVLAWCSALPDLLAVFFGLVAVSVWNRSVVLAVCALLLGCLSKETAALVPLAFGVAGLLRQRWWVAWALSCFLVVGLRLLVGTSMTYDWMDKWTMVPEAIAWSLGGLIWPFPLSAVRDLWVFPSFMLPLSGVLVLGLVWCARRDKLALSGVLLCMVPPTLALPVVLDGYLVGERYMYMATVGLGVWVGTLVRPPSNQQWLAIPVLLLMLVHGMRGQDWKTDEALFQSAVEAYPGSSYAWHFYGISLAKNNKMSEAADAFAYSVEQGHPHPLDRVLCLKALVLSGRGEDAIQWSSNGPQENLTAEHVAWRARAAMLVGDYAHAASLFAVIKTGENYDGPEWVQDAVDELQQNISHRSGFNP